MEGESEAAYLKGKLTTLGISPASHDGFWVRCQDDITEGQWTCDGSSNYWNSDSDNKGFWGKFSAPHTDYIMSMKRKCHVL